MINFPGFNRAVVASVKPKHPSTTRSAAIDKDKAKQKSDRRRPVERRKQRLRRFKGMERRCSERRSGRINISV